MTLAEYEKLKDAIDIVCNFCENDQCEGCQVERLEEDAYVEAMKEDLL